MEFLVTLRRTAKEPDVLVDAYAMIEMALQALLPDDVDLELSVVEDDD